MKLALLRGCIWGRLGVLLACWLVVGVAVSCGGSGAKKPTPAPGVLGLPADLTDEQTAAVMTIPDPGDSTKPLATLVSSRMLDADEAQEAIASDLQFTELQRHAADLGFGEPSSGIELQYDNGVTVTTAVLGEPGDQFVLALRSSEPGDYLLVQRYLIVQFDQATNKVTAYGSQGTVTIDLQTGKVKPAESTQVQHSCSYLHCIATGILVLMDIPVYGDFVEEMCVDCLALILSGVGAPLAEPECLSCAVTLSADLIGSAWFCADDTCDLCMDDSCGSFDSAYYDACAHGLAEDPSTGSSTGIIRVYQGYTCEGITYETSEGVPKPSYLNTQCTPYTQWDGGVLRYCPYGCAEADCVQPTSEPTSTPEPAATPEPTSTPGSSGCNQTNCPREKDQGDAYCTGGLTGRMMQDYRECACVQSSCKCGPVLSKVVEECRYGCADANSCAPQPGLPAEKATNTPVIQMPGVLPTARSGH